MGTNREIAIADCNWPRFVRICADYRIAYCQVGSTKASTVVRMILNDYLRYVHLAKKSANLRTFSQAEAAKKLNIGERSNGVVREA